MNKEFVNLTATQRLMELLASVNHQIAYKMVECVKYRWKSPISFLDFGDTNDTVSFINSPKVWELMDKCGDDYKVQAWVTNRSCIKIGKAIKMIYGDAFPINQPKGTIAPKPPVDIESFVNMFKAERDKNKNYERFELVKGRDIKYWYNQKNYSRFIQEDTTLAKSCLRYEESGKFLEMYVNNPDLVSMLILKDDVERLRGRAIVWNLTYPENRIYMERIYTINDSDVELYKKYAREQGWLYKSRQTYGYQHNIVDGKTNEEFHWENFPMRVQLRRKPVSYYPYLDTLCVYNSETGVICNEGKLLRRPPYIKLSDHQGSFVDEADHREMVFSRHYNDEIAREEAEFVNLDQDWVFQQDAVYVHNSDGKKSHRYSSLICESSIIGNKKYFLKDDCVWSEYLKTYIYKESSRDGFLDNKKTNKVIIHRRMIGKYFDIDNDGYIIKKKIDASMTFEKYLEIKGMSMNSKRSQVEKLYKEWEFNRTINWNEPLDNTDTEEVTPRNNNNSRRYNTNPWDSDIYGISTPTPRRRGSELERVDNPPIRVDDPVDDNTVDTLLRYVQDGLAQTSGIPVSRFSPYAPVDNQQSLGRTVRQNNPVAEEPLQNREVQRNEPRRDWIDMASIHSGDRTIRFTTTLQGRPVMEETTTPMVEESISESDDINIQSDVWDDVNTSADGENPENTSANGSSEINWGDSLRDYRFSWGSSWNGVVFGNTDNNTENR